MEPIQTFHQSFVCTFRWLKQFNLTHRLDCNRYSIPGQSGPGSNGNEGVLHITLCYKTEASLSDGLVSYPGAGVSNPSAKM